MKVSEFVIGLAIGYLLIDKFTKEKKLGFELGKNRHAWRFCFYFFLKRNVFKKI